ncbi:L,D-transpeptidase [Lactobacillus sp. 3B(2020)]|uniref:L,D-transpeptidase n=1 Tax=Lactobacillus sp. 3B(2020) TaxID=2695882 RepID=UPI0015DD7F1D|nr:L,D-transpeptidase [Lactobacillus sp. 3B(2020)]QLL70792.1 L,D-transpeptidase family protein [Lactobacillus sp. 3B(2020)]
MRKTIFKLLLVLGLCFAGLGTTLPVQAKSTPFWQRPSEKKAYPNVKKHPKLWVLVSKKTERTYLVDNGKILYTMLSSTGSKGENSTPTGTFTIQDERGDFFYNQNSGEGAKYWVSWKDHGIYLFHSVPTDQNGNFITKEANQLGKRANSHGCVRLSVADAKWFYQNIQTGTKVVISNSGNIKHLVKSHS